MKIVVCIKQVPDTNEVELDPETNTLIRKGIPVIINPDDKSGIEEALTIRDSIPSSTVTVLSMGPAQAEMALREALAMGCDEAVLVSDRKFGGSDTLATSTILSAALRKIGYDVIVTGRQAIDGDTAQVGPGIAEHLNIPRYHTLKSFYTKMRPLLLFVSSRTDTIRYVLSLHAFLRRLPEVLKSVI